MNVNTPENSYGFRLIEKRFVGEVNADCLFYEHEKSGARLVKIRADDPNKTFSIAFKTFPESDNGAPHIMEHSVLNGSVNFPVKSPFDVLLKGSLNTFMNAFTSKDFTMYPVASMNHRDYFNLMHVYLDAVFNPMIHADPRIFRQEGWHHELTGKGEPVIYKGVVYNEMKGAYSEPNREMFYQVFKALFPDNAYGFESGGYPAAIPALTHEEFLRFHKQYYHPENSYIWLYGDGDLDKELEFLNAGYLSKYDRGNYRASIDDQEPFDSVRNVDAFYPVTDDAPLENQTLLNYSFVAGSNTDQSLCMALDLLAEVLVNQESAPVRLALQEAGIGQDVYASVSNYKQNVFSIDVQNANPGDQDRFMDVLMKTIREAASGGLDKTTVEGVINRIEFRLREGNDAQRGMTAIQQSQPGFFFADDPFLGLEYEKPLAVVKTALNTDFLEDIIRKFMIGNTHAVRVTLAPKTGLDQERNVQIVKELEAFRAGLDETAIETLIAQTEDLVAYQQREDTPEAIATIPMLELADINPKALWYPVSQMDVEGTTVLFHEEFTNDVVYVNLFFDLRVIPQELIPYASLLSNLLGTLNTGNYDYGDLNRELNIHTGGFYTSLKSYSEEMNDAGMLPKFMVSSKAMKDKVGKLFMLAGEILVSTRFRDTERLKTVLARHQAQLESYVKGNGYQVASRRLPSYFSIQGVFGELIGGLDYYWFVSDLTRNFDVRAKEISENLERTASLVFTTGNLVSAVTCGKGALEAFTAGLGSFRQVLPSKTEPYQPWHFNPEKKNEGILAASKVQFVISGYNFKKLGFRWDGRMRVLNQILSTDWLQTRIRVIGGAYGGFSTFSLNGTVTFNSYRDPNLRETIDNYRETAAYLERFDADGQAMLRYIIGTIAGLDSPLTASQKGDQAVTQWFNKRTPADLQCDRDAILSSTPEDIRGFAALIRAVMDQGNLCVYGSEETLKAGQDLFGSLVKIDPE
jgi:Zn-dependent M16 (insulinase) family peptidase